MAEDTLSSEFYWSNIFLKVEDQLFCVPICEFVNSSHVFEDMFLLPSGPTRSEGQDKDHPIVLEGYKKAEFICLLKVMYPTAGSLISGTNLELHLEKEEWVSVLKLSTIWDMKKIRQYAIHRLSTDIILSPIEKILLARAHRVSSWLNEAITSLARDNLKPTLEDLAKCGWETAARILWIRDSLDHPPNSSTLRFTIDEIKCPACASSSRLINSNFDCYNCERVVSPNEEYTYQAPASSMFGTSDDLVAISEITCCYCQGPAFYSTSLSCGSCSFTCSAYNNPTVRITQNKGLKRMIEEMFGEEIKDYELVTTVA